MSIRSRLGYFLIRLVLVLALAAREGVTQDADEGFFLQYTHFPIKQLFEPPSLSANLATGAGDYYAHYTLPARLRRMDALLAVNRLSYELNSFSYENASERVKLYLPASLHAIKYELTLMTGLPKKSPWQVRAFFRLGLATDFKNLSFSHLNIEAGALLHRLGRRRLEYGIGAVYVTDYGKPLWLPAVMLNWNDGGLVHVTVLIPKLLEVWIEPKRSFAVGLVARVDGNYYHVGEEVSMDVNGFDETVSDGRVEYSNVTMGPVFKLEASRRVTLTLAAGNALARVFKFVNAGGEERESLKPEDGVFVRANLQFHR